MSYAVQSYALHQRIINEINDLHKLDNLFINADGIIYSDSSCQNPLELPISLELVTLQSIRVLKPLTITLSDISGNEVYRATPLLIEDYNSVQDGDDVVVWEDVLNKPDFDTLYARRTALAALPPIGEWQFRNATWSDPDTGVARDAKFGDKGVATASLRVGSTTGIVKSVAGVYSASALLASEVPVLDASKITTGVLDPARIPVIPSQVQVVSSGLLADLTAGQQTSIGQGTVVTTTDGNRYVYTGSGSKTLAASYVLLADITPDWTVVTNKPTLVSTWTNDAGYITAASNVTWAKITGTPTTLAGYGITDALTTSYVPAWSAISGKPNTLAGYGIVSGDTMFDAKYAPAVHAHTFASLTSKPTTLAGYGITDAVGTSDSRLTDARTPINNANYVQGINSSRSIELTNFNTATASTFASGNSATGSPAPGWHHLVNVKYTGTSTNDWTFQLAAGFGPSAIGAPPENYFVRIQEGTTWKAWRTLWHNGNFDPSTKADTTHSHGDLTFRDGAIWRNWTGNAVQSVNFKMLYAGGVTPGDSNYSFGFSHDGSRAWVNGGGTVDIGVGGDPKLRVGTNEVTVFAALTGTSATFSSSLSTVRAGLDTNVSLGTTFAILGHKSATSATNYGLAQNDTGNITQVNGGTNLDLQVGGVTKIGISSSQVSISSPASFSSRPTFNGATPWDSANLTNLSQLTNGPGYLTGTTGKAQFALPPTVSVVTWFKIGTIGTVAAASSGQANLMLDAYANYNYGNNQAPWESIRFASRASIFLEVRSMLGAGSGNSYGYTTNGSVLELWVKTTSLFTPNILFQVNTCQGVGASYGLLFQTGTEPSGITYVTTKTVYDDRYLQLTGGALSGALTGTTAAFTGQVESGSVFIAKQAQSGDVAGQGARIALVEPTGNTKGWIIQHGSTTDKLQFFHQDAGSWVEKASITNTGAMRAASLRVNNYGSSTGLIMNATSTNYAGIFTSGTGTQQTITFGQSLIDGTYVSLSDIAANAGTFSGAVTGSNLAIANWNTAYTHSQITSGNPHGTTFASLVSKPTTLAGYGITDAATTTLTNDFAWGNVINDNTNMNTPEAGGTGRSSVGTWTSGTNSPFGNIWYNVVNVRHRNGGGDGAAGWGGQLVWGMTGAQNRIGFRSRNSGATWQPWYELWHTGNLTSPASLTATNTWTAQNTFSNGLRSNEIQLWSAAAGAYRKIVWDHTNSAGIFDLSGNRQGWSVSDLDASGTVSCNWCAASTLSTSDIIMISSSGSTTLSRIPGGRIRMVSCNVMNTSATVTYADASVTIICRAWEGMYRGATEGELMTLSGGNNYAVNGSAGAGYGYRSFVEFWINATTVVWLT